MAWKEIPDIFAVGLLIYAFVAVSRRGENATSRIWLAAWVMIEIHFFAALFLNQSAIFGELAAAVNISALLWAALLFMWAMVPYRSSLSSRLMLAGTIFSNTLYIGCQSLDKIPDWVLTVSASLIGIIPLAITLATAKDRRFRMRWFFTAAYCALSILLLKIQLPQPSTNWVAVAPITVAYAGCFVHFWLRYRRSTAGAIITLFGFFAWAAVFPVGQLVPTLLPNVHIDGEVWNLPKYLVAIGMILLLLEEQLHQNRHMALHDQLTGLPNRRLFLDCLSSAVERARRGKLQMAMLAVDLNEFKAVNDTLGHHVGDLVLQHVTKVLSSRVRKSDTLARTGGDEFAVILEAPAGQKEAQLLRDALTQLVEVPFQVGEQSLNISASIGVAVYPADAKDIHSLCVFADQQMYNVKRTSKLQAEAADSQNPRLNPGISKVNNRIPDAR